ncbi:MAG: phosphotransferase [Ruthenibacterium sp.]
MKQEKLLILGAGGLGRMVGEVAAATGLYAQIAFLDDAVREESIVGACADYTALQGEYVCALPAFGNNRLRLAWTKRLLAAGYTVPSLLHPTAIVSPSAQLGAGCLVLQGAIINTNAQLGTACLANCGALIDHDCVLGDGVHVNLNSTIKAWCKLEALERTEAGEVVYSTRRHIDGVDDLNLEDALFAFRIGERTRYVKPFGSGHINDTYAVYTGRDGGETLRYVIQRINTDVFKDPRAVMENIFGVTEYLRRRILERGGDAERETLRYLKTQTGENYFEDAEGSAWRCYNYISDSVCLQSVTRPIDFYNSAKSFGSFLRTLENYPADTLHETIEKFHDTRYRYEQLLRALERDVKNRAVSCAPEIAFAKAHKDDCSVLMDLLEAGKLPLRVTHNDTKINNILFDADTGEALCVIDLDTIMPGLALNDYGDSIRFGATTAAEDEPDVSKVHFDINLFEMYTKGYLEAAGDALTDTEKEYLPWGAKLMTLECGMRFLADYLQGDTYFKVEQPLQNLYRARTQFKLVADMEQAWDKMLALVKQYSSVPMH